MHQRISVRAIVRRDGKTLLVKRANGRPSILGKFELPGGKLEAGEQPDDAVRRYLKNDAGLAAQTVQLLDAITYTDRDDRDIQYAVIVYLVGLSGGSDSPKLSQNYNKYVWQKMYHVQHELLTEVSQIVLGIAAEKELPDIATVKDSTNDVTTTAEEKYIIYSDGGSRGNPGPSAAGYVVFNTSEELLDQGGEYLGITNNSQAEYHGVRLGLEAALQRGAKRIDFRIDSLLVVNQLNNIYVIKNRELWPIHERIKELVRQFDSVTFRHVKREFNQQADSMVNRILDEHAAK